MEHAVALDLIRAGVTSTGGTWADLGAGSGVFTRALAELLGPSGQVYAVDRQPGRAAATNERWAETAPIQADFTKPLTAPLEPNALDGILMANALHFVRRHEYTLGKIVRYLKPGGTFLLVEYDLTTGSPWIPFPVPFEHFKTLAPRIGLDEVREVGRHPSRYGPREFYTAAAVKEVQK